MSVNADKLVQIVPRIMDGGTPGLSFAGLILSKNPCIPAGRVLQFASAQAVAAYFGSESAEADMAAVYFRGYVNAASLPAKLFVAAHNPAPVSAWLRGAAYKGDLARLKTVTDGGLSLSIDSTPLSLTGIDLSPASSYSAVASILQAALTDERPTSWRASPSPGAVRPARGR